uniref:Uncharacterized protein n=1 Tax=Candidatus Kentrum sp. UNK TaxID=2126344 RepID=A0A451AKB2_9GAMM|nr:MAG: hypothetical protein BECKUNK1418G_GA0071005_109214 [Candidatus Kentron sp. UNK]VFK72422.1 MAG: hypothetical protein BECKUNK1418H_GA0071006_11141 [Candidatus Kentron sp. UNK]
MKITASRIAEWADTHARQAQDQLPRLIRRLCYDPEASREISFPAGDSTYRPGWDGVLSSKKGNAWMPAGASRWEMGCDKEPTTKANGDYRKRTQATSEEERSDCTFVFVTPRRWTKKSHWIAKQRAKGEWKDVRAHDADDLEQWLEQTPAVALQFAEELGLIGPGVESLSRHWDAWSGQCKPPITFEAFLTDRASARDALAEKIQSITSQPDSSPFLTIRADSVEEAAAFAVAVAMASGNPQDRTLVVTEPEGWRYVEANPQLKIAIAARTETAKKPVSRAGLLIIVPHATGDSIMKPATGEDELVLERPDIYQFEQALIAMGVEESDAHRYALNTGRSWTVFRRQQAVNPAIRHPAWLDKSQSASLTLVCLLGAWLNDNSADRQVVERLANRPYEEIERDLRELAIRDDAPVLRIGKVWKAKSPLELLTLFGNGITRSQLDRFFSVAEDLLSTPDPQLELPDEERWMAQIHRKVHPCSGLLFKSVCDSLIKLAVRGPEQAGLDRLNIEGRVAGLVGELLDDAHGERWLSLASFLSALAEAAPEEFLRAVERSLSRPDAPVTRLILETRDSGSTGRCWHCDLLWALETLAWAPRHLARVALILARLSHVPMKGNWGNKPSESLLDLFHYWRPQTAASLDDRIQVLDLLITKEEEVAFGVLIGLLKDGRQIVVTHQSSNPKWREDDAGAGRGVTDAEMHGMIDAAKERILRLSGGNAHRIAALLRTGLWHPQELPKILPLMAPFTETQATDENREVLRAALRERIHWHRNYDKSSTAELNEWLGPVEALYERLAPRDLVIRHRWLFDKSWLDLPRRDRDEGSEERNNTITRVRTSALTEIHQACRMAGIETLITACAEPHIVGTTLAKTAWLNDIPWPEWIAEKGEGFAPSAPMTRCISGFLLAISQPASNDLLRKVIALGERHGWDADKFARFLVLVRVEPETWRLTEECGVEVHAAYWQRVQPTIFFHQKEPEFVLERLLEFKRPRTALQCCASSLEQVSPRRLYAALQQFLQGEEADASQISSYYLAEMLERLEKSNEIKKAELIQLEFGLFPALGYGQESRAAALYEGIMSEPSLFTELIRLCYRPEHGGQEEPTETTQAAVERTYSILQACERLPGIRPDGSIDGEELIRFIDATRELCREADRLETCDETLGQILAHAPKDEDGAWPCAPVKDLLEHPELEKMREGFFFEAFNLRGRKSKRGGLAAIRSRREGGNQERALAAQYRGQAKRLHNSHPNVATMLEEIAEFYEHNGKREDEEANLGKERF